MPSPDVVAPIEVSDRVDRLRLDVGDDGGALVVTKPVNIRWLTGFTGSNGIVVVADDVLVLVTDERYRIQARRQLDEAGCTADVRIGRDLFGLVADDLRARPLVAVEEHHITWERQRRLAELLDGCDIAPAGPVVDRLRRVKDAAELARLERAAGIADAALAHALTVLTDNVGSMTERKLATVIDRAVEDGGADEVSFPTIVASGPNSALPHARPSDRTIRPGDLLLIDMGARCDGYGSDMTRTFAVGGFPTAAHSGSRRVESVDVDADVGADVEVMYRAVEAAQRAGVEAVTDGVSSRHVHEITSQVLVEYGLGEYFAHGTGHGIGLEIHETPFLSSTADDTIRSGYVVTIEPGVYLPGVGGVRIEDSVVASDGGCRPLTRHPKDPVLPV